MKYKLVKTTVEKPVFSSIPPRGMTVEEYSKHHRKKYQEWWRASHKLVPGTAGAEHAARAEEWKPAAKNGNNAEPVALNECPFCHGRFYAVRGSV